VWKPDDRRYVASTWGWSSGLSSTTIDRVLDHPFTRVLVVERDPEHILGWLAIAALPSIRLLHYLYVRREARGVGVARKMIDAAWPANRSLAAPFIYTVPGPATKQLLARFSATRMHLDEALAHR